MLEDAGKAACVERCCKERCALVCRESRYMRCVEMTSLLPMECCPVATLRW
jgi:hypothetical protein